MLVVHGDATGTAQVATVHVGALPVVHIGIPANTGDISSGQVGVRQLRHPHSFPAAGLAAPALDTADFESSGVQAKTRELPDTAFTKSFCPSEWQ